MEFPIFKVIFSSFLSYIIERMEPNAMPWYYSIQCWQKHSYLYLQDLMYKMYIRRKNLVFLWFCWRLVCDGTIFPSLLKDMSSVVGSFYEQAQKLLELHLASGFQKYFLWLRGNRQSDHTALIQKGKDLVSYALINAIAIQKILKKYDKVCPWPAFEFSLFFFAN